MPVRSNSSFNAQATTSGQYAHQFDVPTRGAIWSKSLNNSLRDPPDRLHETLLSALDALLLINSQRPSKGVVILRDHRNLARVDLAFSRNAGVGKIWQQNSPNLFELHDHEACIWMNETSHFSRLWQPFLLQILLLLLAMPVDVHKPSRTQQHFPIAGDDSDGLKGFGAQFQHSGHHSSLHVRDRQRRADRPPADARTRSASWTLRCHR